MNYFKQYFSHVIMLTILVLLIVGCSSQNIGQPALPQNTLNEWAGKYEYFDSHPPNVFYQGYVYIYEADKETHKYYADIMINGWMMSVGATAELQGDEDSIELMFFEDLWPRLPANYQKGDVLLKFKKSEYDIKTEWGKIPQPLDSERKFVKTVASDRQILDGTLLGGWVGKYKYTGVSSGLLYDGFVYIYEADRNNHNYYADIYIDGATTDICVVTSVSGDEQSIFLTLVDYLPGDCSTNQKGTTMLKLEKLEQGIDLTWIGVDVLSNAEDEFVKVSIPPLE